MLPATHDQTAARMLASWEDLYRRRMMQLALFEIQGAAEREPRNASLQFLLAQTQLAMNRPGDAERTVAAAIKANAAGHGAELLADLAAAIKANRLLAAPALPFAWMDGGELDRLARAKPAAAATAASASAPAAKLEMPPLPKLEMPAVPKFEAPPLPKLEAPVLPRLEPLASPSPSPKPSAGAAPPAPRPIAPPPPKPLAPAAAAIPAPPPLPGVAAAAAARVLESPSLGEAKAALGAMEQAWRDWERDLLVDISRGDFEAALGKVDAAAKQYRDNLWVREKRTAVLEKMGRKLLAAEQQREIFRIALDSERREEALHAAQRAIALAKENPEFLKATANILFAAGFATVALDALRAAADHARREGNREALKDILHQFLRQAPGDLTVRQELERLGGKPPAPGEQAPRPSRTEAPRLPRATHSTTIPDALREGSDKAKRIQQAIGATAVAAFLTFFGCGAGVFGGVWVLPTILLLIVNGSHNEVVRAAPDSSFARITAAARAILIFAIVMGIMRSPYPW